MTIHEPATLLTDYLLAALGAYLAWKLHRSPAIDRAASQWWHRALLVLTASAFVGGSYHGFAPNLAPVLDAMWWRIVLWIICLLGFTMGNALVCELADSSSRGFWQRMLLIKFAAASLAVALMPKFLIAIVDYGTAMLAWGIAAILIQRPWSLWILMAVSLSVAAAWIQQSKVTWFTHLNHNDVFHLVQALALIGFYRAARVMSCPKTRLAGEALPLMENQDAT